MKKLYVLFFLSILLVPTQLWSQQVMPMPGIGSTYTGAVRGFWFVAPVSFKIVGLRVPVGSTNNGNQCFQIVKINDPMPIAFGSQSSNFDTYLYTNSAPYGQIYDCNVLINAGDTIGIFGATVNGSNNSNAYGTGSFNSSILGYTVSIQRFGYQSSIVSNQAPLIWGVGYQGSGSISRIEVYYTPAEVSEYPYCEGFENGDGSWSDGGILNSWELGEPDNTFISAAGEEDNAWVTDLDGDYNNDEFSYVNSPEFDLSPLEDPVVRFQGIFDIETTDDGATMQVSTDSGATWSTLGSSSSPSPWFNSSSISSFNALNSSHGWTGTNSGWTYYKHSLSAYQGDTSLFFRYVLSADGAATQEGYGFDDILVAESNDIALTTLTYQDSACGSSADDITAVICNTSVDPKTGFDIVLDTNGTSVTTTYSDTLPVCGCDTINLLTFNTSQGGTWTLDAYVDNTGDVNSANDSISGVMTMYGIPGGSVSGGGNFCEGDIATLTFNFTGFGPWNVQYTNGTSPTYVSGVSSPFTAPITQSGTYTISYLQDSTGCPTDSGSVSGAATFVFNPAPVVDLGPDSTVCGDYVLDAGSGFALYDWSTGATGQMITVTTPGIYSVTVTNSNGCEGSDEVDLEVNPNPIVGMGDTVLCDGATFLFNAGGGYQSYLWHDGSTGQVFQVSGVTTVSVTVTDFNDCEGVGTASITAVVPNPEPNVTGGSGLAPVTMKAPAGFSGYLWNTGATTQTIDVYISGTYTCTVTDNSGCDGEDDAKAKIWPTNVEEIVAEDGLAVYPNPASESIFLQLDKSKETPLKINMMDMNGKRVMTLTPNGSHIQELSIPDNLSNGQYIIRVGLRNEWLDVPVTIQR